MEGPWMVWWGWRVRGACVGNESGYGPDVPLPDGNVGGVARWLPATTGGDTVDGWREITDRRSPAAKSTAVRAAGD